MEDFDKKKVDDSWKEAVDKEKQGDIKKEEALPEEPDFAFFVSTLAMQAAIALGDLENPMTNKKETELRQAKFFIDTLSMIKEKTHGNLSLEEDNYLDSIIYELKMRFVQKIQNKGVEGK